jgi:hypothetical protein
VKDGGVVKIANSSIISVVNNRMRSLVGKFSFLKSFGTVNYPSGLTQVSSSGRGWWRRGRALGFNGDESLIAKNLWKARHSVSTVAVNGYPQT